MPLQHASLSEDRWSSFSLDQQILMIGNEMNRAAKLMSPADADRLRNSYERILNLADLTIRVNSRRGLRRELLRWRDRIASLYVSPQPDPQMHQALFKVLLCMTPQAARQRPYVLSEAKSPPGSAD